MKIHSYPKVWNLGHPQADGWNDGPVTIQEKYDGSQFSWCWDEDGNLHCRSKGSIQFGGPENRTEPDKLFNKAIQYLLTLEPYASASVFRGEVMNSPKHNSLEYEREPSNNLVLFDVEYEPNRFCNSAAVSVWAEELGIESAVVLHEGEELPEDYMGFLEPLLKQKPLLGGPMIEGIVIKNYNQFGNDKKIICTKLVAEDFKEIHSKSWRKENPTKGDVIEKIIEELNTPQRWHKAIQHLREKGELSGEPKDIGPCMKEIKQDTIEECEDYIRDALYEFAKPQIVRALGRGFPEFYKRKLAKGEIVAS